MASLSDAVEAGLSFRTLENISSRESPHLGCDVINMVTGHPAGRNGRVIRSARVLFNETSDSLEDFD